MRDYYRQIRYYLSFRHVKSKITPQRSRTSGDMVASDTTHMTCGICLRRPYSLQEAVDLKRGAPPCCSTEAAMTRSVEEGRAGGGRPTLRVMRSRHLRRHQGRGPRGRPYGAALSLTGWQHHSILIGIPLGDQPCMLEYVESRLECRSSNFGMRTPGSQPLIGRNCVGEYG